MSVSSELRRELGHIMGSIHDARSTLMLGLEQARAARAAHVATFDASAHAGTAHCLASLSAAIADGDLAAEHLAAADTRIQSYLGMLGPDAAALRATSPRLLPSVGSASEPPGPTPDEVSGVNDEKRSRFQRFRRESYRLSARDDVEFLIKEMDRGPLYTEIRHRDQGDRSMGGQPSTPEAHDMVAMVLATTMVIDAVGSALARVWRTRKKNEGESAGDDDR